MHVQAALFLYMNYIQEHSPFLYTYLPSNFFSNQLVFHHYSQLHYKCLSPISPQIPPPLSTYPPLHLMALPLFHSLPWILLLSLQQLILLFPLPMFLPYLFSQYYLNFTQISHLTIARNILSISALSSLSPLSFYHPPLHTSTCRNVLVQPNHLLSDYEYITLAILFH